MVCRLAQVVSLEIVEEWLPKGDIWGGFKIANCLVFF